MRRRDRKQVILKGLNTTRSSIGGSSVAAQNAKVRVRSETEPDLSIIEGKFDAKIKQNGGWKLPAIRERYFGQERIPDGLRKLLFHAKFTAHK